MAKSSSPFFTHTLPCGLRIVCAAGQTDACYIGVAVDAGTRHEMPRESGMAHLVEHLSFKGTSRRTARQIMSTMEGVGGELNAFTGKEETVYYCTCLAGHVRRAVDLLLDITLCSVFPEDEMEKEVEVVVDEIESYRDQPSDLIYDEFESLMFPCHPLGRNILGDAESLRSYRPADVLRFTNRLYHPERMVLYVLGNVDPGLVVREAEKSLARGDWHRRTRGLTLPHAAMDDAGCGNRHVVRQMQTHQAHVVVGARSFSATDPRHIRLFLLNNMLGGPAMSCRLNLALRERAGLVYTVESSNAAYTDAGLWSVYYGCDAKDRARCRRLVARELDKLVQHPLSQRTLDAARRQLKGQIGLSYDNFENVAIGMAKRFLHYGTTLSREQLFAQLDAITPDELLQTAQCVFSPDRLLTLEYV